MLKSASFFLSIHWGARAEATLTQIEIVTLIIKIRKNTKNPSQKTRGIEVQKPKNKTKNKKMKNTFTGIFHLSISRFCS